MSIKQEDFAEVLVQKGHCSDLEEASVLADLVYQEIPILSESNEDDDAIHPTQEEMTTWNDLLQDLLGVDTDQSKLLLKEVFLMEDSEDEKEDGDEDENDEAPAGYDGEDDDAIPLFPGECELCDRLMKMTKHHLIPKSTWPRMESRLRNAAEAKEKGDIEKASVILGDGMMHLLDRFEDSRRSTIRALMTETCDICRPCHSNIHRAHDNVTLAMSFSSVDLLLQDENIAKFCKWVSKQRPGKYAL